MPPVPKKNPQDGPEIALAGHFWMLSFSYSHRLFAEPMTADSALTSTL
jgi:hypothetical protein